MSEVKNGGEAFPLQIHVSPGSEIQNGMFLRDWFAGMAVQGILANSEFTCGKDDVAMYAYQYADAMLEARDK